jgi:uncharacterized delta-60 repeat protein
VTTNFGGTAETAFAVAIQADGKIVAGGVTDTAGVADFALARYNPDGSLDTSFGILGKVVTNMGNVNDQIQALVVQQDGKIVAVGFSGTDIALARYTTNGALDSSFNGTGQVITSVGTTDRAYGAILQPDGKIIAIGSGVISGFVNFALVRYNTDGSLDTSFNGTGKVTTFLGGLDNVARAGVLQKDGKILAVGYSNVGSSYKYALVRYNTDGSLDSSFNGTGIVTTTIVGQSQAFGAAIQKDGRVIAIGTANIAGTTTMGLSRYHVDGSLDTSFGTNGLVTTNFSGGVSVDALDGVLQEDGKLVTVGTNFSSPTVFALARYNIFKRPCLIQDCIALENGQDGFNIVDAAQVTLLRNIASNNGCSGFIAPAPFDSTLDILAKNLADNNQCANFSNIDSALLDVAVLPWGNVRGN